METLTIHRPLRNHRLQNRKLARYGQRYRTDPELIHAVERPASMAWGMTWSLVNRRSLTTQGGL